MAPFDSAEKELECRGSPCELVKVLSGVEAATAPAAGTWEVIVHPALSLFAEHSLSFFRLVIVSMLESSTRLALVY